jgi:hypothetical protein
MNLVMIKLIVIQEVEAIARKRCGKHGSTSTNEHTTIEELLEAVFPVWSVLKLYSEDQWEKLVRSWSQGSVGVSC